MHAGRLPKLAKSRKAFRQTGKRSNAAKKAKAVLRPLSLKEKVFFMGFYSLIILRDV